MTAWGQRWLMRLLLLVPLLSWQWAFGQSPVVSQDERRQDLLMLDSFLQPWVAGWASTESGLAARNRLVQEAESPLATGRLDWALALQGWLAQAGDAHLRVAFEGATERRCGEASPPCSRLLEGWADFGPGPNVSESAQCAWLEKTWPWVGALRPDSMSAEAGARMQIEAEMSVEDHGAFVRWVIPSFGQGKASAFAREFRRARRAVRRRNKPVMLDLRGNLGGYRTRRHAVLGAFLSEEGWPEEAEGAWEPMARLEAVSPMPLVRTRRPISVPAAVLLDGGSFSASLLLSDALLLSGRAKVFGCAPLGLRGGCSGSPVSVRLPGSGLRVLVPSLRTALANVKAVPFALSGDADCDAAGLAWREAVRWLLAGDLVPLR